MPNFFTRSTIIMAYVLTLILNRYTNELKDLYATMGSDVEKFISHPVNTYLFVKRLTTDWKDAEDVLNQALGRGP